MILQTNPLLIDLIIEHILEYLPEKDLKSCRLVCTQWYRPGTKNLQKVSKSIFFGDLYKVNLIRLRPDLETIKLFMSAMSSSETLPYVKFDLRPSIFASSKLNLLEDFFNSFGSKIQVLKVHLAYESADIFPKGCFPSLNLSNLKSLDFCNTIRGELRPSLRTELLTTRHNLLAAFLQAAPNLETLNFWCDSENVAWPGEAIEALRQAYLPKLRNLKISFPLTNYQIANLSRINIQLTSFIFLIREPVFNTDSFLQILLSQKDTLKSLKIIDLQCDSPKFLEIPVMKELNRFEIDGTFYGDNCQLSFFNFAFKKLPKIETIILRNCHSQNFDLESFFATYNNNQSTQVCQSLRELHVTIAHDFVNLRWIKEIAKMFPKLQNLHAIFSLEAKDLLTSVFQNLKNLECLTLNVRKCGENLDSILTGVVSNVIYDKRLLDNCYYVDGMELSRLKTNPGLVDLPNLKVLEFKGEYRNYKAGTSAFTDVSAYLAFFHMKNLRNLVLWQTGLNLSHQCVDEMSRRFHLVQIHPDDHYNVMY